MLLLFDLTEVPLRRSALSVCPWGDPWDTPPPNRNQWFMGPCKAPLGTNTKVTSAKGQFCAHPSTIYMCLFIDMVNIVIIISLLLRIISIVFVIVIVVVMIIIVMIISCYCYPRGTSRGPSRAGTRGCGRRRTRSPRLRIIGCEKTYSPNLHCMLGIYQ